MIIQTDGADSLSGEEYIKEALSSSIETVNIYHDDTVAYMVGGDDKTRCYGVYGV